jgi:hypothetical protein
VREQLNGVVQNIERSITKRIPQNSSIYHLKKYANTSSMTKLFTNETKADTFYFIYCLIHIPITILIDSGLTIPHEYQPEIQKRIISFHISQNKDFLLQSPPTWLVLFGWIEVLFQLPLFFLAAYALYKRMFHRSLFFPICMLTAQDTHSSIHTCSCMVLRRQ